MTRRLELGGYFALECYGTAPYHRDAITLNSARNALRYILRAYGIRTLYVPFYTCPVIWDALCQEGCAVHFYDIDEQFMPSREFPKDAFILYTDYFGICARQVEWLSERYPNLLVDNAQSFYASPKGLASFYSPRKFFGVPDGGLLVCGKTLAEPLEQDVSYDRVSHLMKRYDMGPRAGYDAFKRNDASLAGQPVKAMSRLTRAMMSNINYDAARAARLANYGYLRSRLDSLNELTLPDVLVCPMVYPLLIKDDTVRERLIERGIYVAHYWDRVTEYAPPGAYSLDLADRLVPLPIDQRYGIYEMEHIVGVLEELS